MHAKPMISAFAAIAMLMTPAMAEQKQQSGGTSSGNAKLCKTLYEVYDMNMEAFYDKKASAKDRQSSYANAQKAISDFRKSGCKHRDVAQ